MRRGNQSEPTVGEKRLFRNRLSGYYGIYTLRNSNEPARISSFLASVERFLATENIREHCGADISVTRFFFFSRIIGSSKLGHYR